MGCMKKVNFEWDEEKDLLNRTKHGVSFFEAQYLTYSLSPNMI